MQETNNTLWAETKFDTYEARPMALVTVKDSDSPGTGEGASLALHPASELGMGLEWLDCHVKTSTDACQSFDDVCSVSCNEAAAFGGCTSCKIKVGISEP